MEPISLASQTIFHIGPFAITNTIIATWLAMLTLIIIGLSLGKIKNIPEGLQNIAEFAIESLLNLVDGITHDREKSRRFFPWIASFFLFILIANWMELIPGFGSIGLRGIENGKEAFIPILRGANTDINTTLALGLISALMTQIFGIIAIGIIKYGKKFINFSSPIEFFVGILELISEVARIISFAFRLFGNIFAGEVLLIVITFLAPYIIPVPFYGMELFVGFIQALVFSMLTLVFMTIASMDHEEHENIKTQEQNNK